MFDRSKEQIRHIWNWTRFAASAVIYDRRLLKQLGHVGRGYVSNEHWPSHSATKASTDRVGPLRAYFDAHTHGRGIWKWDHYFDVYERHFSPFRDQEVHILEIGIYSGGSLEMWRDYFGPRCQIYGVDIEPACKTYEGESIKVFIGDQADRSFWKLFRSKVPTLDIVIDDGGHLPEQQIVTLEELLPHLQPSGIYLCEDVHGAYNAFASYVQGLAHKLNACERISYGNKERSIICNTTEFQSAVRSIHLYPFMTVIEKTGAPVTELVAPKHGTQWAAFRP